MREIILRQAKPEDMMLLYRWVNDPLVRTNSFQSRPITLEEHQRWFRAALDDPNVSIYILMSDEKPIGQVRLNRENGIQLIDYSIDPKYRGQGFGAEILSIIEQHCDRNLPLVGKVRLNNVASQRIFQKLGYAPSKEVDCICYTKILTGRSANEHSDSVEPSVAPTVH